MPHSYGTFDHVVNALFQFAKPEKILDIGCGAGKYGTLAKAVIPDAKRIAIEIEEKYVEKYQLRKLYDEVRVGDAQKVLNDTASENYDLVIFGDSIEHMPKSVGLDLLNFLTYRSQYILILVPEFVIQHEQDGVAEEAHVSVWSESDLAWHDRWAWDNCWAISFFLLRGYVKSKTTLGDIVKAINSAKIPITAEDTPRIMRHANLQLNVRERHNHAEDGQRVSFRPP